MAPAVGYRRIRLRRVIFKGMRHGERTDAPSTGCLSCAPFVVGVASAAMLQIKRLGTFSLVIGAVSAIYGLVMWLYFDVATALISFALLVALFGVAALIGQHPHASRVRRWRQAVGAAILIGGLALSAGAAGDRYRGLGTGLVIACVYPVFHSRVARLWDQKVGRPTFGVGSVRADDDPAPPSGPSRP